MSNWLGSKKHAIAGEQGLVQLGGDLLFGVAAHAELIDLVPAVHDVRRRAFSTPGPGLVSNVVVRLAVAVRAADVGPRVGDRNVLERVVYVTNVTATIVGGWARRRVGTRAVIEQKQKLILEQERRLIFRRRFPTRLWFLFGLDSSATHSSDNDCRQNEHQETISHTVCPGIALSGRIHTGAFPRREHVIGRRLWTTRIPSL